MKAERAFLLAAVLCMPCAAATVSGRVAPAVTPAGLAAGIQGHLSFLAPQLPPGSISPRVLASALEARLMAPSIRPEEVYAGAAMLEALHKHERLEHLQGYLAGATTDGQPGLGRQVSAELARLYAAMPSHPEARDALDASLTRLHRSLAADPARAGWLDAFFDERRPGSGEADAAMVPSKGKPMPVIGRLKPYAPSAPVPKTESVPGLAEDDEPLPDEGPRPIRMLRALGQALRLIPRPRVAYRGMTGLPVMQTEPTQAQRKNIERIEALVQGELSSRAPRSIFPQEDRRRVAETRLLGYFTQWLKSQGQGRANFNLSLTEARGWGENSTMPVVGTGSDSEGAPWAVEALKRIGSLKIVLRATLPAGQEYSPDRHQDTPLGNMAHAPEKLLAGIPTEDLLYLVRVDGRWLKASDPRARAVWEPLFRFERDVKDVVLNAAPDATLDELNAGVRQAYERSGLASAR